MSSKENQKIAEEVIAAIGGKENIVSLAHCATRLRIVVKDREKVNEKALDKIDKAKGYFFTAGQYQIIFGTGLVNDVYEAVKEEGVSTASKDELNDVAAEQSGWFQRSIRMFADVFVPIIPALVATGLFMGLQGLLTQPALLKMMGMSAKSIPVQFTTYFNILTGTAFSFLPVLICWSAFRVFGGSPILGILLGLMLVNPALPSAWDVAQGKVAPLMFFGFIPVAGYQASVLPAFILGFIGAKTEKWIHKHVISSLDLIVTPFATLLVGSILGLLCVGPIFRIVEQGILHAAEWIVQLPFGLGGLIWGAVCQMIVVTGLHHALNLVEIQLLANTHWNPVNPIGSAAIAAQAGAALAVALRIHSNKMKQIAYPSTISALLGITEPAIYGVNIKYIKPFLFGCIGGGVGGFLSSILNLKATGMSITVIPGILLFLNQQLPLYILVCVVGFGVAFGLTYVYYGKHAFDSNNKNNQKEDIEKKQNTFTQEPSHVSDEVIDAPVSGKIEALNLVSDKAFASGMMGKGIAIEPSSNNIVSPVNGTITVVYPTGHAYGIKSDDGAEILIHLGIDTVNLKGKGFSTVVKQGQKVNKGELLGTYDYKEIGEKGYDNIVIVLITNSKDYAEVDPIASGDVKAQQKLIALTEPTMTEQVKGTLNEMN
ncbi:MAG: sucrose-specific PTS transporter subunit IIBC [Lactobacillus johnsonii]|uniref:sucrose-specific PTS transporter subunit IIBC n=1 Tax=Lactobacillus johnsonii TaxID=33959 RepID=UPI000214D71B|nr:sucrose-specific PTS transporter subunit IIBC [Lactobacillus johnsonii]MCI7590579.1 sucrose-specific PTS transporter subunit IIBC [Lactobacillus johnsonii]MCI7647710.1 sucrose-specific PTS transporter subunit IIBC [Lactobacillus johnsonii]MDD7005491.1 sucrose-specific PTS transporter subunit IIBC [Lactobacillus johnsonii]MDY5418717.1 sucrose-specific PTS transporter subunit IIBC [Lactobacillus johnsonii]MDY5611331.1 sucrose-specific PTS transporter subunit IIBC [Lactobacillus johnsonii]